MRNFTLTTFLLILTIQLNGQTIYVNGSLPTNGDGTSWASAFNNLQSAIEAANNNNEIWVAKGTYYPSKDKTGNANPTDNRTKTFFIDKNIKIYGGFVGTEVSISERNIDTNPTILSGDIGVISDKSDNTRNIITLIQNIILDGFQIIGGNANDSNFGNGNHGGGINNKSEASTIINCTFNNNFANLGGAISNVFGIKIDKCIFVGNSAIQGGAIYTETHGTYFMETNPYYRYKSNININNSVFEFNVAESGGAFYNHYSGSADGLIDPNNLGTEIIQNVTNCIFFNNNGSNGGAVYNLTTSLYFDNDNISETYLNCTFYNNYAFGLGDSIIGNTALAVFNCIFYNGLQDNFEPYLNNPIVNVNNNPYILNSFFNNPFFLTDNPKGPDNKWGTADDGLQLSACSPAINAGDNALVPPEISTDLIGNNRIQQSNVDMGAYESSINNAPTISSINATNESYQINSTYYLNSCNTLIAKVEGNNTANSISGPTTAKVWIEPIKIVHNSLPIVSRHYEITPTLNPTTSTGRITLYFTQQEFDTYNNDPSTILDLPTDPNDAIGKGILRVKKISGISSDGTGLPSSFSGPEVELNPLDSDIIWNQDQARWEVSFDVTGFSGFFVQGATVLPLNLINFDAFIKNTRIQLTWQTANETNFSHFELQRSGDAQKFVNIGTVKGSNESDYKFLDEKPIIGINYYRLKMIDLDGKFTYSKIVAVNLEEENVIHINPNPTAGKANLNLADKTHLLNSFATLCNSSGQTVKQFKINKLTEEIDLGPLPKAVYLIRFEDGTSLKVLKE